MIKRITGSKFVYIMDLAVKEHIDGLFEKSLEDPFLLDKKDISFLLSLDPLSEDCRYMGSKARELARIRCNNKAQVGTAFGLDYRPCKGNCVYCSFGEKWGVMKDDYEIPFENIISMIRERLSKGFRQFTIRTTEYYSTDKLCELGKRIRSEVDGQYNLSVNTGELSADACRRLYDAGYRGAYHTLHLREGIDTGLSPESRLRTMDVIKDSELNLSTGVDAIGIEHTDEEIADTILALREYRTQGICSMKRINPKGTPVEGIEEVSDERVAQIAAILRFATASENVSAVPPNRIAMEWGANNTSVGTGANPRDSVHDHNTVGEWRFDMDFVREMLIDAGYEIRAPGVKSHEPVCPICFTVMDYSGAIMEKCSRCGRIMRCNHKCPSGHSICHDCMTQSFDNAVKDVCARSCSKDPSVVLEELLAAPIIAQRFLKYHSIVASALTAAYFNAIGDRAELMASLDEVLRRGRFIPPKACGHGGVCGAAVSCGIFYSTITKTEPLSGDTWGDIHILNGRCLIKVGEVGGPRCCNRDANISIIETVKFVKEKLGVEMELHDVRCMHSSDNKQCIGERCPFHTV